MDGFVHLAYVVSKEIQLECPFSMVDIFPSAVFDRTALQNHEALIDVEDPSTNVVIAKIGNASADQIDQVVKCARASFLNGAWAKMGAEERQVTLREIAHKIDENANQLARLESRNTGIPEWQVKGRHIARAAYNFRFFADFIGQYSSRIYEQNANYLTFVRRDPIGVAALIAPWNAPIALGSMKIAAAIAFGNSCIIKPSEQAPLGVTRLVELIQEVESLPSGVVNLINGDGRVVGDALVRHDGIDLVSFTGGTTTGKAIMRSAADGLKPVTMELGGKSANIIFEDADLERALDGALLGIFTNNGQQCLAGSRILVQESIAEAFIPAFIERAKKINIGQPSEVGTQLGPLSSRLHMDRVLSYVEIARADGGEILMAGERPVGLETGNFVSPIVTRLPSNAARVCQEEIFGPFAAFLTFNTEEEAFKIANDTKFGLVSYVWSQNVSRIMRAQDALRSGVVWVNTPMMRELSAPFGGYKDSGIGAEGGEACLQFYTHPKTVTIPRQDIALNKLGA